MIAAVLAIALGALAFDARELPGIEVTGVRPLSGKAITNYSHADLDGDGLTDILLDDAILFQRQGGYPAASRYALPDAGDAARLQAWNGDLYLWSESLLSRYRWHERGWERVVAYALPRPETDPLPAASGATGGRRQAFLHDFDGDGTPEVFSVTPEGVHVFARHGAGYNEAGLLNILPGRRITSDAVPRLWLPEARRLSFPVLKMACRLVMEGDGITVLLREAVDSETVRYGRTRYRWDGEQAVARGTETTQAVASYLHPCRLNDDGMLDLAGGCEKTSETTMLPLPVYETWASLDGGKTFHVRRSASIPGFRPRCAFVDFDGDGQADMITEETGLFEGGAREAMSRLLTLPEVGHTVRVFRQQDGGFARQPALRAVFVIRLESPAAAQGDMFSRYRAGKLVDVSGDFDGDGSRDLVVQDRIDRLSVHLVRDWIFRSTPDAVLSIDRAAQFAVADVNDDGRSDIVLHEEGKMSRVYFSREEGP